MPPRRVYKKKTYSAAERKAYGAGLRAKARSSPARSSTARHYSPRVKGRGDYKVIRGKGVAPAAGGLIGGAIGGAIAPGIGAPIGAGLGMLAGSLFSKITGMGDYNVHYNTLMQGGGVPNFGPSSIRVRHKEYLGDISSSVAFSNQGFPINPGLDNSFPWLSAVAQNYQQWRPNGIVFMFGSTSADALNSTNTALGKVVLATNYDSASPNFVNVQQMLGSEFANYGKPSDNIMHAIECDPGETQMRLFSVRTGSVPSGQDPKTFDLGNFQIATQGSQAQANIGGLWVVYDITFVKPVQNNQVGLGLNTDHFVLTAPSQSGSKYFGTSNQMRTGSALGCSVINDTILFPALQSTGMFLVTYSAIGASTVVAQPTLTLAGCNLVANMFTGATANRQNNTGLTTTIYMEQYVVQVTSQNASVVYTGGTLPTSPNVGDLYISQINGNLT